MFVDYLETHHLSSEDQDDLKDRVSDFERSWSTDRLATIIRGLPEDLPYRFELIVATVAIDLKRRWKDGRKVLIEQYIKAWPELGTPATVPPALVAAEYEARCENENPPPSFTDMAKRFPRQVARIQESMDRTIDQPSTQDGDPDATFDSKDSNSRRADISAHVRLPEKFGRYRILELIGKGGMGSVFLAEDDQLNRKVALKVPHFTEEDDERTLARFTREARAAAAIDHPNICPVYDVGEFDRIRYLTMSYIEGKPLSDLIRRPAGISHTKAAMLTRKLAQALAEAHQHGVIHRDLKPSNIMINRRGEPIIMDFGLARSMNGNDSRITLQGSIIGTPNYMPPEQIDGEMETLGPQCDVYALGVILYEMLSGRVPFDGSVTKVLARVLTEEAPQLTELCPTLDGKLAAICHQAMHRRIENRYATMNELASALTQYLREMKSGIPVATAPNENDQETEVIPPSAADEKLEAIHAQTVATPPPVPSGKRCAHFESTPTPPPVPGEKKHTPPSMPDEQPTAHIETNPKPPPVPHDNKTAGAEFTASPTAQNQRSSPIKGDDVRPRRDFPARQRDRREPESDGVNWAKVIPLAGAGIVVLVVVIIVIVNLAGGSNDEQENQQTPATKTVPKKIVLTPPKKTEFANWTRFTHGEGRFALRLPHKPTKITQRIRIATGEEIFMSRYELTDGKYVFAAVYGEYPAEPSTKEKRAAIYDAERDRIAAAFGGKVVQHEIVTLNKTHEGRVFTVEKKTTSSVVQKKVMMYLVGSRMFLVTVVAQPDGITARDPTYFFDSFEIW